MSQTLIPNSPVIPVVLFAYARPDHLRRLLTCLKENKVPIVYAFSDGPKTSNMAERVSEVRQILREINWCLVHLVERPKNLGLGKSILTGVTEVFQKYEAIIVFEDDLVCVPDSYVYMCAALEHYKDDSRVMSITGWTHPDITPSTIHELPYFDGRAESWSWGSWARAWKGMEQDAMSLMKQCEKQGIDIYKYGTDLPEAARAEKQKNLWAVRFNYNHILNSGLCLRPAHSMVNHLGFDSFGTNALSPSNLSLETLEPCPIIPQQWPEAIENHECSALWRKIIGERPSMQHPSLRLLAKKLSQSFPIMVAKSIIRRIKVPFLNPQRIWTNLLKLIILMNYRHIERLGSDYGGWTICPDGLGTKSIVYSIGIGEDISFDLELIKKYGCHVFAFDPTPRSIQWLKAQNLPQQYSYFELGLANYNGEATFYPPENLEHISHTILNRPETQSRAITVFVQTLHTIMQKMEHNKIDLLKMDIEGAEYDVIENILLTNLNIQQILVEFHYFPPNVSLLCTMKSTLRLLSKGYSLFALSPSGDEYSFIKKAGTRYG
jgi:FkbM family methyltransferase